jgi:glycosyltransferase involved in cell wall biosynthesis
MAGQYPIAEMKVVVFGNCSGLGGAQTSFRRLVDFFVAAGHGVGVIGLTHSAAELPLRGKTAFAVRVNEGNASPVRKVAQTLRAAARARYYEPEIFVAVGLAKSASIIAQLLASRTFRICQDFIYGRKIDDPLLRSCLRGFDALAVQAPSMVSALRAQGFGLRPLSWLPCFPELPHSGFRRVRRGDSQIRLVYMGRLAPNKGLDLLLEALAIAKLPKAIVVDIWGGGVELPKLSSLAVERGLVSAVRFCGNYPEGTGHAKLICSYDGLVLPSRGLEGLPLILLEAMACGVPFLATRVGAIPDCCIDNEDAILVEPNVGSLRTGLERFVERAASGTFSVERLIRYYQSHFSSEVMAKRWREMLVDPRSFFSVDA